MNILCGIYKITSPSKRIYIGQGINIEKRWRDYKAKNNKTKRQVKLWRSFLKYGVENHTFEIVELCEVSILNCRERYWQDFYNVVVEGLNCILQECGEKRRVLSQDTIDKIRKYNIGRTPSLENRKNTSERMLGNTYSLNRNRSEEEKLRISSTMKIVCKGSGNSMFGKYGQDNPNSKIILNTNTGIFYYGIKEASIFNGIPYSSLKKMLSNGRKNTTALVYV